MSFEAPVRPNKDRVFAACSLPGDMSGIELLFARFMVPGTMLMGADFVFDARNEGGPAVFDLGAVSLPLDFNAVTLMSADDDAAVVTEANRALDLDNLQAQLSFHLLDAYDDDGDLDTNFTMESVDDGGDGETLQSFFTIMMPRKIHNLRALTTSIWGFSTEGVPVASKLGGQFTIKRKFYYPQPSVFMIFARRGPISAYANLHGTVWSDDHSVDTDTTYGPSDMTLGSTDVWKAIMSPRWRDELTPAELKMMQEPWRSLPDTAADNIFLNGDDNEQNSILLGLNGYLRTRSDLGWEEARNLV